MKEAEVIDAGSAGKVDDSVQPVPLDVAQRHVPLVVHLVAGASVGEVPCVVGEVPEHDTGATQHPDRPRRRRPVLGAHHDPEQRRRDVPQRVREPDQRGVLLHPAVGPRGRDDQQEAEVGDRRWSRRRCCSLSIVERAEKRGADVGRRRGAGGGQRREGGQSADGEAEGEVHGGFDPWLHPLLGHLGRLHLLLLASLSACRCSVWRVKLEFRLNVDDVFVV